MHWHSGRALYFLVTHDVPATTFLNPQLFPNFMPSSLKLNSSVQQDL